MVRNPIRICKAGRLAGVFGVSVMLFLSFSIPSRAQNRSRDLSTDADAIIVGRAPGEAVIAGTPGRLSGAMHSISADVTGDGVSDLITSLSLASAPEKPTAGRVYIVFGQRNLAPGTIRDLGRVAPDVTVLGKAEGDRLGTSLAAGDVNGDGIKDVIIGAPFADEPDREDVGNVYVLFGGPTLGQTATRDMASDSTGPDVKITGWGGADGMNADLAGTSVAAGDINGDGVDDVAVGAPGQEGPNGEGRGGLAGFGADGGAVFVFFGSQTIPSLRDASQGLPAGVNMAIYGRVAKIRLIPALPAAEFGDALGSAVTIGDVNGDELDDIIIGAPNAVTDNNDRLASGAVYVIFGRQKSVSDPPSPTNGGLFDVEQSRRNGASGFPAPDATIIGADSGNSLGARLTTGDVNGDGRADIITSSVAIQVADQIEATGNQITVIFGNSSLTDRDLANGVDLRIAGAVGSDQVGFSVTAGDVNGDGTADFIIGAPSANGSDNRTAAGQVLILFGGAGLGNDISLSSENANIAIVGANFGDQVGFSVTSGDFNGDGTTDAIMNSPFADSPGEMHNPKIGVTYVIFGGSS